jgi:hypothetical protein
LVVPPDRVVSPFESFKADATNPGVNNLEQEISKLKTLRSVGVPLEAFRSIPWKVLQMLKHRGWNEKASEMREHPHVVRYALLATFVHLRLAEVTDDVVDLRGIDSTFLFFLRRFSYRATVGREGECLIHSLLRSKCDLEWRVAR